MIPGFGLGVREFRDETGIVPGTVCCARGDLPEDHLNGVVGGDPFKGILHYRAHALAVHQHISHQTALVGGDGKGFRSIAVEAYLTAG